MDAPNFTPSDLTSHLIPNIPPSMYYIPSFLTAEEQSALLHTLSTPPIAHRWTTLTHRRLQAWPSVLSLKTNTLLSAPLPLWLSDPIIPRLQSLALFADAPHKAPNHCLVNEYRPGEGIMAHEDGGAYWGCVATVSLGSSIVLDVVGKGEDQRTWRVLQEPGSLLVTLGDVYASTLHGIAEVEVDDGLGPETVANWNLLGKEIRERIVRDAGRSVRATRTSLTFRDVLRVSDVGRKILGSGRR